MMKKDLGRSASLTAHHFFTLLNFVILLIVAASLFYNMHLLRREIEAVKSDVRPLLEENKKTASRPFVDFVFRSRDIRQFEPGPDEGGGGHGMMGMTVAPDEGAGDHNMQMTTAPDEGGGNHSMMTAAPQIEPGPHEKNVNETTVAPHITQSGENGTSESPHVESGPHEQSANQTTVSPPTKLGPDEQNTTQPTEGAETPHGGMDGMEQPKPHSTPAKLNCTQVQEGGVHFSLLWVECAAHVILSWTP